MLSSFPERVLVEILEKLPLRDIYTFINCGLCVYEAYHVMGFFPIYERIKHWPRKKQVEAWFNFYYFLPPQGSKQWVAGRGCGFGGSEMSTLEGCNPHSNMRELLARKLKLPEGDFDGSIATRWGNIFEPASQIYIEIMLDSKIYETGNIPGIIRNAKGRRIQNYSPDGVILTKKENFRYLIDKTSQKYFERPASNGSKFHALPDELILLMEFKNPYMRVPNGKITDYYTSQPKAGMCTIPITEAALFVDSVFRKCCIDEFNLGPRYDTAFHCRQARRLTYQSAMACGFIGVYDVTRSFEKEETFDELDSSDEWALSEEHVSEPNDSGTESDPESEKDDRIWLNNDEIEEIAKQITIYAMKEVKQTGSDYFQLKFAITNLATIAHMLWGFFQNVIETSKYDDYYIPKESGVEVLKVAIFRLFKFQLLQDSGKKIFTKKSQEQLQHMSDIMYTILPDMVKYFSPHTRSEYNMDNLDFGIDYGLTSKSSCTANEFEKLAEKIVNDRHDDGEYKMYHPDKFFFDVESPEAAKLAKPHNYIDYTLDSEKSAKKWLYQNVEEFIEWCKKEDVRPIGIIPWKLFEVAAMVMYKDPNYLENSRAKIVRAMDIVDEINDACDPDDVYGKMQMLDQYYLPKKVKARAVPTKEQIRKRERVDAATAAWAEDLDDVTSDSE